MSRTNIFKQSVAPISGCFPSPVETPNTFDVLSPRVLPTWPGIFWRLPIMLMVMSLRQVIICGWFVIIKFTTQSARPEY